MGKVRLKKKHGIIVGAAIIVLAASLTTFFILRKPKPVAGEPVVTYSTDSPDESKANADNYNWRGAPDEPKKIRIPAIGVDAFVQKAGIDQNKAVAVPNNLFLTSWFSEGAKPGQNGLSIIDGHVTGKTTDGVFKNLKDLKEGDEINVELGNGSSVTYTTMKTSSVPVKDAAGVLFSQDPKVSSQLNLITCGGKFNKETNQYENRIIVTSKLKS